MPGKKFKKSKHFKKKTEEELQSDRDKTNPWQRQDEQGGVDLNDPDSERNSFIPMFDLDDPTLDSEDNDIIDDDGNDRYW